MRALDSPWNVMTRRLQRRLPAGGYGHHRSSRNPRLPYRGLSSECRAQPDQNKPGESAATILRMPGQKRNTRLPRSPLVPTPLAPSLHALPPTTTHHHPHRRHIPPPTTIHHRPPLLQVLVPRRYAPVTQPDLTKINGGMEEGRRLSPSRFPL